MCEWENRKKGGGNELTPWGVSKRIGNAVDAGVVRGGTFGRRREERLKKT